MGLLGVDTSLAPRISEEFESLILHQIKASTPWFMIGSTGPMIMLDKDSG
ncbi:hypothetical protein GECvBMG_gp085c [Salmonella phage GEC_vB_MG]|nr:hypothetical protein GECvBMG_gp085c [Salmonella phage GEC_vB_MG]